MPVTSQHPQYASMLDDWLDCRHFYGGEKTVKAQTIRYLPKPTDATNNEYKAYLKRAFFFPAFERTVAGLSGAIDRKAPSVTLPPRLEYMRDDADGDGASLRQFSKVIVDENFITGRVGIMVDRDPNGGFPYLVSYQAEDIINWQETREEGLTMVVLREEFFASDPADPFVLKLRKRFRILSLEEGHYVQRMYEQTGKNAYAPTGDPIVPTKFGVPLTRIPFVFCNVRSITSRVDKPPLLDLAYKNAEHLRVSADYANALYFTGNPILWAAGVKKSAQKHGAKEINEPQFKISIGSSRAVYLPKDGSIGLLECSGHGVNPNRDRAEDIKMEMAVIGARLLENQRKGVEAAETAQIRQSGETSTLSNIVVNCSAAIKKALEIANEWEGGKDDEVEFSLNTDFVDVTINPQLITALKDLVTAELISWDTFYHNLAIGEIAVPGRTAEEERDLIETQPPIGTASNNESIIDSMLNGTTNRAIGAQDEKEKENEDDK